jgi:DNA invertase Pin-like site-specific DNA recombinase
MKWGYARVSTQGQNHLSQVQELEAAGVLSAYIVVEHVSGEVGRPKLADLVKRLRQGDELIVTSIDRLGRHARDMHDLLAVLKSMQVRLISLFEKLDTSTYLGEFLANVLIANSVWEREKVRERTKTGIQRARERGIHLGRPYRLTAIEERTALAWRNDGWSIPKIAKSLHCGESTVYRAIKRVSKT